MSRRASVGLALTVALFVLAAVSVGAYFYAKRSNNPIAATIGGTNLLRLTTEIANDWHPDYSPDAKRIAFASNRDGATEIYTMRADGSDVRRLTFNNAEDDCPAWSPDGTRIAFQSRRDGHMEIYVMNADGSNQRNLSNQPGEDTRPPGRPMASASSMAATLSTCRIILKSTRWTPAPARTKSG